MVFDFDNHNKGAEEKDFANADDTWIEEVEALREICVLNGIVSISRTFEVWQRCTYMDIL